MAVGPVALGSDHGGYRLKDALKRHLISRGIATVVVGTDSEEPCDYPVFARQAAEAVASGRARRAVLVDGAGIGSCMVANKIPGVRAAMVFDLATTTNAREHNDANVLCLGAGTVGEDAARAIVDSFLSAECTAERHKRRVAMIDALDESLRRAPTMPSSPNDHELLVQKITKVLTDQPALLAPWVGSPLGVTDSLCGPCTCCGHCAAKHAEKIRGLLAHAPGARLGSGLGTAQVPKDLASLIDHTLLKPEGTYGDIDQLCDEAAKFGFASVCINPAFVRRCAQRLRGSHPVVCTVIGFPLGATTTQDKVLEARRALRDGARELDMVLAIGALKSGDHQAVFDDIRMVAEAAREGNALLKVILETALLTDEEKVAACVLSRRARADFVKTSTGFSKGGATEHDVALMAQAVGYELGVKASGGVRSAEDARRMIQAGATRIGASVGVKILGEARGGGKSNAKGAQGERGPKTGSRPGSTH